MELKNISEGVVFPLPLFLFPMSQDEMLQAILKKLEKLDSLETSVGSLETSVGSLETSVGSLETSVGSLETSVGSLETSVGNLETSVEGLKTDGKKRDDAISALNRFAAEQLEQNVKVMDTLGRIEKKIEEGEERDERFEAQLDQIYAFLEREMSRHSDANLEDAQRYTNIKVQEHEQKFEHTPVGT